MNKIYIGIESQKKREQILKDIRSRMCLNDTYTDGCDCASCKIALEYHPDFLEISTGKKEASDDAILFCQEVPSVAPTKVVLVSNADNMTPNSANALLKVVEEGPGQFVFSSTAPLISTLNSRCATITVSSLVSEEEGYGGLTPMALRYATGREEGLIAQFTESKFFDLLKGLCDMCERMKNRNEWLSFFHLVMEKDKQEFFSTHSKDEVRAVLNLISGIFFSVALGEGHVLSDYSSISKLYDRKAALLVCEEVNKFLYLLDEARINKNDFFVLITKLI